MTVRNIFIFLQQRDLERIFCQWDVIELSFWDGDSVVVSLFTIATFVCAGGGV